jgi:hypothetical protein
MGETVFNPLLTISLEIKPTKSYYELFFCQTLISKIASWVKSFFLSSHRGMRWNKAKK